MTEEESGGTGALSSESPEGARVTLLSEVDNGHNGSPKGMQAELLPDDSKLGKEEEEDPSKEDSCEEEESG